jgi:outer membrane protein assembly factor BamD (BamD/ComL family)
LNKFLLLPASLLALALLSSCSVLSGTRDIASADALFKKKQYANAVAAYRNMLQETPDSFYSADARYGLAMALIAADNPQKDYAQALHEFEAFYKLYPGDWRVSEVRNWIAVLKTLSDRSRSIEQLKRLDIRHEERRRK